MPGTLASVLIFDMDKLLLAFHFLLIFSIASVFLSTTGIVPGTGRRRKSGPGKSPNADQLVLCQGSGHCQIYVPPPCGSPSYLASRFSFVEDSFSTDQG